MEKYKFQIPENIEEETKYFIGIIIDNLESQNRLDETYEGGLRMLTKAYDTYIKCNKKLDEEGFIMVSDRGNQSISAYYLIAKDAHKQVLQLIQEFGLSPKSSGKLKVIENETEETPLKQLMNEFKK